MYKVILFCLLVFLGACNMPMLSEESIRLLNGAEKNFHCQKAAISTKEVDGSEILILQFDQCKDANNDQLMEIANFIKNEAQSRAYNALWVVITQNENIDTIKMPIVLNK